ncbi:ATPase [Burkholderia multivorans]|uniref:ATPase n=1 Tax=Burkholderia multivorans TaxID=87883 RepID=UPI000D002C20|nr:ATPase [Burkholderia multivorans]PRG59009.1 ATPase [Burkholderia multivorans]
MSEKSYVSIEQHFCVVCGSTFETGNILLELRVRPNLDRYTATGWGLCPEHQKLADEDYVALVECDPQRSGLSADTERVKPGQVHRTGRVAHLKRHLFSRIFSVAASETEPFVFVEPGVIELLQSMSAPTKD